MDFLARLKLKPLLNYGIYLATPMSLKLLVKPDPNRIISTSFCTSSDAIALLYPRCEKYEFV